MSRVAVSLFLGAASLGQETGKLSDSPREFAQLRAGRRLDEHALRRCQPFVERRRALPRFDDDVGANTEGDDAVAKSFQVMACVNRVGTQNEIEIALVGYRRHSGCEFESRAAART